MDPVAERGGERVEHFLARARDRNCRALRVQRARDRFANGAGGAGDQRGFTAEIEHYLVLPALKAATSSGVPIAVVVAPSAIRLLRPASTLPAPIS